jgi:hypothetical protein
MTRPPSNVVHCQPEHVMYLAAHMRPDEIEQWLAFTGKPEYRPREFAAFCYHKKGPCYTVLDNNGLPAAAGGYFYIAPGVWQSWMAGTMHGWATHWRSITKAVRWLMESMFKIGAKRLETYVLSNRTRAIEWYTRALGMACDRPLPGYANGLDAGLYFREAA